MQNSSDFQWSQQTDKKREKTVFVNICSENRNMTQSQHAVCRHWNSIDIVTNRSTTIVIVKVITRPMSPCRYNRGRCIHLTYSLDSSIKPWDNLNQQNITTCQTDIWPNWLENYQDFIFFLDIQVLHPQCYISITITSTSEHGLEYHK